MDLSSTSSSVTLRDLPDLPKREPPKEPTVATAEECSASCMLLHPEVLLSLLFSEPLSSEECLKISGLLVKSPIKGQGGGGAGGGMPGSEEALCLLDKMACQPIATSESGKGLIMEELDNYIKSLTIGEKGKVSS